MGSNPFGEFPGFPSGWPFGINGPKPPKPTVTEAPAPLPPQVIDSGVGAGGCRTSRGDHGYCATLRQCYPVLYNSEADEEHLEISRNPGLADLLRSVAGPCESPQTAYQYFYFKAGEKKKT